MTVPSLGSVLAVFHLAHAMRLGSVDSLDSWERQASQKASFVAAAVDHRPIAEFLMTTSIVDCSGRFWTSKALGPVSFRADRSTKLSIAILLLTLAPPSWLSIAVVEGNVFREYIPARDLKALSWLADDLEWVLSEADRRVGSESRPLHLGLGRAAELLLLEIFSNEDLNPIHVADISDNFGYDVECCARGFAKWEVKAATESTASSFYLTRNEFDVALASPVDWILVQVVVSSRVFASTTIAAKHIVDIRALDVESVRACVPEDSSSFRWLGEALVTPPISLWRDVMLSPPSALRLPGLEALASESLELRSPAGSS